jgi:hypothetical protein
MRSNKQLYFNIKNMIITIICGLVGTEMIITFGEMNIHKFVIYFFGILLSLAIGSIGYINRIKEEKQ